ncbi:hypothetical protein BJX70DRAFT_399602 [Aspergillus crustosus]
MAATGSVAAMDVMESVVLNTGAQDAVSILCGQTHACSATPTTTTTTITTTSDASTITNSFMFVSHSVEPASALQSISASITSERSVWDATRWKSTTSTTPSATKATTRTTTGTKVTGTPTVTASVPNGSASNWCHVMAKSGPNVVNVSNSDSKLTTPLSLEDSLGLKLNGVGISTLDSFSPVRFTLVVSGTRELLFRRTTRMRKGSARCTSHAMMMWTVVQNALRMLWYILGLKPELGVSDVLDIKPTGIFQFVLGLCWVIAQGDTALMVLESLLVKSLDHL